MQGLYSFCKSISDKFLTYLKNQIEQSARIESEIEERKREIEQKYLFSKPNHF